MSTHADGRPLTAVVSAPLDGGDGQSRPVEILGVTDADAPATRR